MPTAPRQVPASHAACGNSARALRVGQVVVEGVAAPCGFSHQEHLTRVIRSHLGTTPAVLRREG